MVSSRSAARVSVCLLAWTAAFGVALTASVAGAEARSGQARPEEDAPRLEDTTLRAPPPPLVPEPPSPAEPELDDESDPPEADPEEAEAPEQPAADDESEEEPPAATKAANTTSKQSPAKTNAEKKKATKQSTKKATKKATKQSTKKATKTSTKPSTSRAKKKPAKRGHPDCDYRTPVFEHVVVRGEHLGAIAGRYGVRRKDLLRLNPTLEKNPNLIRPGQTVRVCPELAPRERVERAHEVAAGESLGVIARAHGMTTRELIGLQRGALRSQLERDPNHVRVGTALRIVVDQEVLDEFEPPSEDAGRLKVGVSLRPRAGLVIKRPHLAFGTKPTIRALERALKLYRRRTKGGGPPVRVGDISKRGGGPLDPHVSHQRGVDVDIGVILTGSKARTERFTRPSKSNLDLERTWTLIRSLLDTDQVRVIFLDYSLQKRLYKHAKKSGVSEDELDEVFQYPRGRGRAHGIVRHWKGHLGHMHVRLRH